MPLGFGVGLGLLVGLVFAYLADTWEENGGGKG